MTRQTMFMPSTSIFIYSSWNDFVDFRRRLTLVPGAALDVDGIGLEIEHKTLVTLASAVVS
jgi:hypothetical protein